MVAAGALSRRRGRRWPWAFIAVVGTAAVTAMPMAMVSAASPTGARPPAVVRPRFRYIADAVWIWTGPRYALAGSGVPLPGPVGSWPATLIDDQTGQRTKVSRAGCYPVRPSLLEPPDLPWVPFQCGPLGSPPAPALYSPTTGRWLVVSPGPAISNPNPCGEPACAVSYSLTAAGRQWLAYEQDACVGGQHCSVRTVFQNLAHGELRRDPSGGGVTVDLNSPSLTRGVCRPLRLPTEARGYSPARPGSLLFFGRFALSIGSSYHTGTQVILERCGTHLHRLVTTNPSPFPDSTLLPAGNLHELVWMARPGRSLSALTFPHLQPFTIRLPARLVPGTCASETVLDCVGQVGLTSQRLYLLTRPANPYTPEQVWAAPTLPPRQRYNN